MQSSLQFAEVVEEELIARHNCNLKGIYLSGTWSTSVNGQKATSPGIASYKSGVTPAGVTNTGYQTL